jgi:acyl-coenzyme A thioesterase PaaI-like protein
MDVRQRGEMKRDYFYEVDLRGRVSCNGLELDDSLFLDTLYRRLAPSANADIGEYPFVSRCGEEMNYLRPSDSPIVFTRFDSQRLGYAGTLSVRFNPAELVFSEDGVLYHRAPIDEWGRCAPSVTVEIAKRIIPWGPWYAYCTDDGREHVLEPKVADPNRTLLRPKFDNQCVGCGAANPASLSLSFLHDHVHGTVESWLTPTNTMQGAMGTVHGGLVSLLLDEVMGKSLSVKLIKAPTAKLEVNFRLPMLIGERYHCVSLLEESSGRKHYVTGTVRRLDGTVVADARGLFIAPRQRSTS